MLSLRRFCQILLITAILAVTILGFRSPLETTLYTFSSSKLPCSPAWIYRLKWAEFSAFQPYPKPDRTNLCAFNGKSSQY